LDLFFKLISDCGIGCFSGNFSINFSFSGNSVFDPLLDLLQTSAFFILYWGVAFLRGMRVPKQSWVTSNTKIRSHSSILIQSRVDLGDIHSTFKNGGELIPSWSQFLAMTAPRGVELDKPELLIVDYFIKLWAIQYLDVRVSIISWCLGGFALSSLLSGHSFAIKCKLDKCF